MLEEAGYKVSTHTDREWEVTTPKEEVIVFKCDTGVCKGMQYIDLHKHGEGRVMVGTIRNILEEFTKREIERAEQVRAVQRRIFGHPMDEHLKIIVSQQSLKNNPIRSTGIADTKAMSGPSIETIFETNADSVAGGERRQGRSSRRCKGGSIRV